jgi:bifunctional UDP-N-acetylglucosamine pyrophosphorylase/glucosamine-1-phosphate N-acetyltransferase
MTRRVAAVILAAGKGTRMKSDLHKVLHPIAGRPMIEHLLDAVEALGAERVVVVVGDRREQLEAALDRRDVQFAVQEPQLGTAHAVLQAEQALAGFDGDVLLLSGDVPFIRTGTMRMMLDALHGDAEPAAIVLGFRPPDAGAYGRIVAGADGLIAKMVEHKDATEEERAVGLCNSNLFAVRSADLWPLLKRIGNDNAQGEYYLPDIVMVAASDGRASLVLEGEAAEAIGPNSRGEFALAEAAWQGRRRAVAMAEGATLIAPETVWFAFDTRLGRDVTIEPNVFFGPGVTLADGVRIRAFSHIEGADIASGAEIGPYARLRPGTVIGKRRRSAISSRPRRRSSAPGPRPITSPISATPRSGRAPMSAPARSPAITTAISNTARRSARTPSSAPTRRWSPPSASAPAPSSARDRW